MQSNDVVKILSLCIHRVWCCCFLVKYHFSCFHLFEITSHNEFKQCVSLLMPNPVHLFFIDPLEIGTKISLVCCLWSFCFCYGFLCSLCISYKIYGFFHMQGFLSFVDCIWLSFNAFKKCFKFQCAFLLISIHYIHVSSFLVKVIYLLLSFPCLAKPCMFFTFTKHHIAFNLL